MSPHLAIAAKRSTFSDNMDVFGVFSEYINPFTCPINTFEVLILDNYFLCCTFWMGYDLMMYFIEKHCGIEAVDTIETYRDMVIPLMRERCPGNRNDSAGCTIIQHSLILLFFSFFLVIVWTVAVTIIWLRLRKQAKQCSNQEILFSSTTPVELQPLGNGKASGV